MRVLVAGASGAIGTRLVPQLIDRGHDVIGTATSLYSATDAESIAAPCLLPGGAFAEGFDGRLRLPELEDVDPTGVDQVGGDGEVLAVSCPACLSTTLTQPAG